MTTDNTTTNYELVVNGPTTQSSINMSSISDSWTDEDALALYEAMSTWTPPAGTTWQMYKVTTDDTTSTAGGSPAAFS